MRLAQVARLDERHCSLGINAAWGSTYGTFVSFRHCRNVSHPKTLWWIGCCYILLIMKLLNSRGPSCHPLNRSLGRKLLELPLCMWLGVRLDDLRACDVMCSLCSLNGGAPLSAPQRRS
eukprot:scaffold55832_cov54-Phaeocystis_antarctica.AAC.2